MGRKVIGNSSAMATGARVLLGAVLVAAAANIAATPAWARPTRHRVVFTTTTSTPATTTTTVLASTTTTETTMPAPIPPAPAPADTCAKGVWPAEVQGRPQFFQAGDGVYLWDDPDGGWALRATHSSPNDTAVISGTLTTTGKFIDVRRNDLGNDIVAVSANKRTILFRFVNYGWVDGLDFATRCAPGFSASIYIAGTLAPTTSIHLGGSATAPGTNPFRVLRGRATVVSSSVVRAASGTDMMAGTATV
jgi:hypothetical protein